MSSFDFRSKWAIFKGHIPSYLGATLVIGTCGLVAIGLLSTVRGQPLDIAWPGGKFVTGPVPATPEVTNVAAASKADRLIKGWSERQKDVAWPFQETTPANPDTLPKIKTDVAGHHLDISSQRKRARRALLMAKRDWGMFQVEIAVQGDYDIDHTHSNEWSYVRNGVRFHLQKMKCDPQYLMPQVCHLPRTVPRPVVRGW